MLPFESRVKYPRTPHLPGSPGMTNDDRLILPEDLARLRKVENYVVTAKMDGENTTMSRGGCWNRSLDGKTHSSKDYVKNLWGRVKWEIPNGWRICGEDLYAKHSIHYTDLPSYFLVFSVWDDKNMCLSWEDTLHFCGVKCLHPVPTIGTWWDLSVALSVLPNLDEEKEEGRVIRNAGSFHFDDFHRNVAKWVRKDHVQTDEHWKNQPIVPNLLRSKVTA